MTLLLLIAALAASPDPDPPPAPSTTPAATAVASPDAWPPAVPLKPLSAPDWADFNIYPPEARALEQEGRVAIEALVGPDGVPQACRIVRSSGFAELDSGTCVLIMQMRFAPPTDARGRNVPTVFRTGLLWLLGEPTPFAPARLTATLDFDRGQATGCTLRPGGAVPAIWTRLACRVLTGETDYYFGAARYAARRATVVIDVTPAGSEEISAALPRGTAVAVRRTEFELTADGDPRNCRTTRDEGFGTPRADHATPCGFFLVKTWFETDAADRAPAGVFQLSVYVEGAPSRGRGPRSGAKPAWR